MLAGSARVRAALDEIVKEAQVGILAHQNPAMGSADQVLANQSRNSADRRHMAPPLRGGGKMADRRARGFVRPPPDPRPEPHAHTARPSRPWAPCSSPPRRSPIHPSPA